MATFLALEVDNGMNVGNFLLFSNDVNIAARLAKDSLDVDKGHVGHGAGILEKGLEIGRQ